MNPESSGNNGNPEGEMSLSERLAKMRDQISAANQRTFEVTKKIEDTIGIEDSAGLLKKRAITKAFQEHRVSEVAEIRNLIIVTDDKIPNLENNEITITSFKKRYGLTSDNS